MEILLWVGLYLLVGLVTTGVSYAFLDMDESTVVLLPVFWPVVLGLAVFLLPGSAVVLFVDWIRDFNDRRRERKIDRG